MQQKEKETALKMKKKGYSVEDIADITGLTVEELKKEFTLRRKARQIRKE